MKVRVRNFNFRHPERNEEEGTEEVFVGNLDDDAFDALPFATKRRGNKAYSATGALILAARPSFVQRSELETHPEGEHVIWTLLQNDLW